MRALRWLRDNGLQAAILLAPFVLLAAAWDRFPERIATHWGSDGSPTSWESKTRGLLFPPLLSVGLALVLGWIPQLYPKLRLDPEPNSRKGAAIDLLRLALTTYISYGAILIALEALGRHVITPGLAVDSVLLLLVLLANYIGMVNPNYFLGRRAAFAPETDEAWLAAQRRAGRVMVYGILVFLGLQLVLPQAWLIGCFAIYVVATGAWSLLDSMRRFPTQPKPPHP